MTSVVYSPRVWLLWVDGIGVYYECGYCGLIIDGVLTLSVAIVG